MSNNDTIKPVAQPKQTSAVTQLEQNVDLLRNRLNKESRNTLINTIIIHKRELAETQMLLSGLREEIESVKNLLPKSPESESKNV